MSEQNKPYIGGQAVLEGVMMRAPGCMSVAVRKPDGSIAISEGPLPAKLNRFGKVPGLRGIFTLVESMTLGYRALNFSAEQQLSEEEKKELEGKGGGGAAWLSILFAIGLFIALPQFATAGAGTLFGIELDVHDWRFHAIRGGVKLLVFTLYLVFISQFKDVKRVFQYHGAEHKTIYAYEAGLELTVENVRKQSTLHPRCGTTFLIVVIFISVVLGILVTPRVIPQGIPFWLGHVLNVGVYVALMPLIAAVSYELQRVSARFFTKGPLRVFLWPGFLFQKITTREPTDDQIEIAIAAMRTAMWREKAGEAVAAPAEPVYFPSFEGFLEGLPTLRSSGSASAS
ncbi:MAG: DUF1385 domain-containing protein [Sandaracinaceae bacterium]